MLEKFSQFMRGRYGVDQLNRATQWVMLVSLVLGIFTKYRIFSIITLVCIFVIYYRMFSKDIRKRQLENQKYLKMTAPVRSKWKRVRRRWNDRKVYRYVTCSQCGQELRLPKGKGKIKVRCISCNHEFTMKT